MTEVEEINPESGVPAEPDSEVTGSKRARLVELIAWLLVVALAVAAVLIHREFAGQDDQKAQAQLAIDTAEEQVLDLTTLDYRNIKKQLDVMRGRTVGDFRRQFEGILTTFAQVVEKDKITAKGEIAASGLETLREKRATVLVASTAEVTSVSSQQASKRTYRFKVTLKLVGQVWRVAGMEFVA